LGFPSRESEGSFEYGNYWTEVDDLHAVAQHFRESNRVIRAIVGHSKGILICLHILKKKNVYLDVLLDVCVPIYTITHRSFSIIHLNYDESCRWVG
jgi:hypothetical protein